MQIENLMVELVNKVSQDLREYKENTLGQSELSQMTISQYYFLSAIDKLESPNYSDLAKELKVSKPSVTASVNKLIQQGFIHKIQNEKDKRVFHLKLSEKGESLMKAEKRVSYEFANNIVSCLDKEELQQLETIFTKILESIE